MKFKIDAKKRVSAKKSLFILLAEQEKNEAATVIQNAWRNRLKKCSLCNCTVYCDQFDDHSKLCCDCYDREVDLYYNEEQEDEERSPKCCCYCGGDADDGSVGGFCSRWCMHQMERRYER